LKIALLTDGIFPYVIGGMQKHSHYLASFLAQKGNDITLVHCLPAGKELPDEEQVKKDLGLPESSNLKSIVLSFPKAGALPGHYLKESFAYSKLVFDSISENLNDFDLIYAKGFSSWFLLEEKRKGPKMPPVAIKFHGYEMFQKAPNWKVRLEHWMLRGPVKFHHQHCDFVFSYGGKITALIKDLGPTPDQIREIPTGIASEWCRKEELETSTNDKRQFVFVGRYERRKGIEELNEALKSLEHRNDFEMHMVGPMPESKKLKSENIIYHGTVMDKVKMQSILDQAEVLITPSHSEGMPNVIMEGMARGLAIIGTDVGAVAAQVGPENGWLVEPGNSQDLSQTMKNIIEMPSNDLLAYRKRSVAKVLSQFTWEQVIQQTQDAFLSCLHKDS